MPPYQELVSFGVELSNPVWRVSLKRYTPFSAPPAALQIDGRFDDPLEPSGDNDEFYSVLYCSPDPLTAFLESIGMLRPRLGVLSDLLADTLLTVDERDADSGYQHSLGVVTTNWQAANQLTSGTIITQAPVFDLTSAAAVQAMRFHLAPSLIALGLDDLDFSHVLSDNRDLTRAISRWLWTMTNDAGKPLFSGIRYRSRFDPECICLALYEGRYDVEGEIDLQDITPDTPGFAEAASILRLTIA